MLRHIMANAGKYSRMSSNIQIAKTCLNCGKDFTAKTFTTRYCGHACNSQHYKKLKREEKLNAYHVAQEEPKQETANGFDATLQHKEFLSIEETAALIGASRRTIHRLISGSKLKVGKIGSRTIIKRTEIDKLFK